MIPRSEIPPVSPDDVVFAAVVAGTSSIARLRSARELNSVPFGVNEMNWRATAHMLRAPIMPKQTSKSFALSETGVEVEEELVERPISYWAPKVW
jgi:hypothetical protein